MDDAAGKHAELEDAAHQEQEAREKAEEDAKRIEGEKQNIIDTETKGKI